MKTQLAQIHELNVHLTMVEQQIHFHTISFLLGSFLFLFSYLMIATPEQHSGSWSSAEFL